MTPVGVKGLSRTSRHFHFATFWLTLTRTLSANACLTLTDLYDCLLKYKLSQQERSRDYTQGLGKLNIADIVNGKVGLLQIRSDDSKERFVMQL